MFGHSGTHEVRALLRAGVRMGRLDAAMPAAETLASFFSTGPVPMRVVVGAAGLVLAFAGAKLYEVAVVLPGLLLGVTLGVGAGQLFGLAPLPTLLAAAIAGGVGGILAKMFERGALRLVGFVAGLAGLQLAVVYLAAQPAWWAWLLVAGLGALLMPYVWKLVLAPVTGLLGAALVADAAGFPGNPWLVLGVGVVGTGVQWGLLARKKEED